MSIREGGGTTSSLFTCSRSPPGCGGTLRTLGGLLASPSYPDSYPNDADCWWRIAAAMGHSVHLSFRAFDLETTDHCNGDYLEVGTDIHNHRLYCEAQMLVKDLVYFVSAIRWM